jgi:hypothetical protein
VALPLGSGDRIAYRSRGVSSGGVDPSLHEAPGIGGRKMFGGVIRLFRPAGVVVVDEIDAAAIDDLNVIGPANDDERGPPGMRLETEPDPHRGYILSDSR